MYYISKERRWGLTKSRTYKWFWCDSKLSTTKELTLLKEGIKTYGDCNDIDKVYIEKCDRTEYTNDQL